MMPELREGYEQVCAACGRWKNNNITPCSTCGDIGKPTVTRRAPDLRERYDGMMEAMQRPSAVTEEEIADVFGSHQPVRAAASEGWRLERTKSMTEYYGVIYRWTLELPRRRGPAACSIDSFDDTKHIGYVVLYIGEDEMAQYSLTVGHRGNPTQVHLNYEPLADVTLENFGEKIDESLRSMMLNHHRAMKIKSEYEDAIRKVTGVQKTCSI